MSKLLTNFLRHFKICPDQYTLNIFRVVSSVVELSRRLKLNLTEHDINWIKIVKIALPRASISSVAMGKLG